MVQCIWLLNLGDFVSLYDHFRQVALCARLACAVQRPQGTGDRFHSNLSQQMSRCFVCEAPHMVEREAAQCMAGGSEWRKNGMLLHGTPDD